MRLIAHPFVRFFLGKVAFYVLAGVVSLTLVFLIPRLMPGNPVDLMISPSGTGIGPGGPGAGLTGALEQIRAVMQEHFGLDRPLHVQYVRFWQGIFRGDLGPSYAFALRPVSEIVLPALAFTLALVLPVLGISFFLGNAIGARAAFTGRWSKLFYDVSLFLSRMPFFWFAMILVFLLGSRARLFPMHGWHTPELTPSLTLGFALNMAWHYVLPFVALLVGSVGIWTVGMRSMMLYERHADYILYCQQLGFRDKTLRKYAQRNAILPQVTGVNLILSSLIGQTMVTEVVFGWPGLGQVGFTAVLNLDYPLILGTFLVTVVVVLFGNFLVDILYGIIDPRIRTGYLGR
jgi:peptide/nickel transport system permease protein